MGSIEKSMKKEWRFCKDCTTLIHGYANDRAPRCNPCKIKFWNKYH